MKSHAKARDCLPHSLKHCCPQRFLPTPEAHNTLYLCVHTFRRRSSLKRILAPNTHTSTDRLMADPYPRLFHEDSMLLHKINTYRERVVEVRGTEKGTYYMYAENGKKAFW